MAVCKKDVLDASERIALITGRIYFFKKLYVDTSKHERILYYRIYDDSNKAIYTIPEEIFKTSLIPLKNG